MDTKCAKCSEPINTMTDTGVFDNGKLYCRKCCREDSHGTVHKLHLKVHYRSDSAEYGNIEK